MLLKFAPPLREHDAPLEQNAPELIDQSGPLANQAITGTVKRLNVELLLALQLDESHRWPSSGFGDTFRITVIVLLCFHIGPRVLR